MRGDEPLGEHARVVVVFHPDDRVEVFDQRFAGFDRRFEGGVRPDALAPRRVRFADELRETSPRRLQNFDKILGEIRF